MEIMKKKMGNEQRSFYDRFIVLFFLKVIKQVHD